MLNSLFLHICTIYAHKLFIDAHYIYYNEDNMKDSYIPQQNLGTESLDMSISYRKPHQLVIL